VVFDVGIADMSASSTRLLDKTPKAAGAISRLAYAHAAAKGVRVDRLLRKAELSPELLLTQSGHDGPTPPHSFPRYLNSGLPITS